MCSGSWDCTINLWNVSTSETDGVSVSVKKRKKDGRVEEPQSEVLHYLLDDIRA